MSNTLSREIGVIQLITYYFSTVVGAGIFIVPLHAAKIAGPASILSWLLALLIAVPFAFIFAHISARYKVSGSIQKFLEDSAGVKFGRSMALFLVTAAFIGNSLLGFTSASYVLNILEIKNQDLVYVVGVFMLGLSCIFNLLNVGVSSKIQSFGILLLILFVELIVIFSVPSYTSSNLVPFMPNGIGGVFAATVICFYSVTGWENVDGMAEEVKDPYRTYGKAIKIAILLIGLFYLSIAVTTVATLDRYELAVGETILSELLGKISNAATSKIGSLIAVFILILGSNAWVFGTSRWIFALSRDNVLPKKLSKVHPKTSVPSNAILAQIFIYAFVAILMMFHELKIDFIVELASLCYLLLYTVIFFCGIKSFHTKKLKILSTCSMLTTLFFLFYTSNNVLAVALMCMLGSFVFVFLIRKNLK